LYFYKGDKSFKIGKDQVSLLIPDKYQEYLYMFYVKDRENNELIEKMDGIYNGLKHKFKM